MKPPQSIEQAARKRVALAKDQIEHSLEMRDRGTPLAAEPDPVRLTSRLRAKAFLTNEEALNVVAGIRYRASGRAEGEKLAGPERIYGPTLDFVGVSFLARGSTAARAVARVAYRDGQALGSGFMISDRLFLTNNHVIGAEAETPDILLEFDYELDLMDRQRQHTRFCLDPGSFFLTNGKDDLDFTIVAVGDCVSGPGSLAAYGSCPLSAAKDKHALGEVANIIQHPDGRYKEVVLRENRLVSRLSTVLHYVADTEPGSSGSPVFNNEWQVIALHHWGGPWREKTDNGHSVPSEVNEGIRTSAIIARLERERAKLSSTMGALLDQALRHGERTNGIQPAEQYPMHGAPEGVRVEPDGRLTLSIPIEFSIRLPNLGRPAAMDGRVSASPTPIEAPPGAERKLALDPSYSSRQGYKPGFIPGHQVELPRMNAAVRKQAARNIQAEPGDSPFELKYHHFSVVMNKERRLAIFAACNMDGTSAKDINRKTGSVTPRKPGQESLGGAEASERWFEDDRISSDEVTNQDLYESQEVPGYPDKRKRAWQSRMFQRGHLVRRVDPAWGPEDQALKAEADTFHFTNCTPQVGFFNMGTAPAKPGTGGGQLWRAIEDYVLDNAVVEQKRVCVFTGPVLANDDVPWREHVFAGFRVPKRFWKVVVWNDGSALRSVALLADQGKVIEVMPEALPGAEVYVDTTNVQDFVTTVGTIETLTGLDFGPQVRAADINGAKLLEHVGKGKSLAGALKPISTFEEVPALRVLLRENGSNGHGRKSTTRFLPGDREDFLRTIRSGRTDLEGVRKPRRKKVRR